MAAKVNTRFVLILVVALVVIVGGVAVAVYWFNLRDPAVNIARGDAAMALAKDDLAKGKKTQAQQELSEALLEYGKALSRRKSDVPLITRYLDALDLTDVDNPKDARRAVDQMRGLLQQALTVEPANDAILRRMMTLYYHLGKNFGELDLWTMMYNQCQNTLKVAPNSITARKYRGIAQVYRARLVDLDVAKRDQARSDLQAALAKDPNDLLALYHLALWYLNEAHTIELSRLNLEKAAQYKQKARELSQEMLAKSPDDPQERLNRVQILLEVQDTTEATPELNKLEAQLLAKPQPTSVVLQMADLLRRVDHERVDRGPSLPATTRGFQRAQALLEAGIKAHPDDIRLYDALANLFVQQGMTDQALAILDKALALKLHGPPLQAMTYWYYQADCSRAHIDQLLAKAQTQKNAEERKKLIAQAKSELSASTLNPDSAMYHLLAGKLAMAEGNLPEAANHLDRACTLFNDTNIEALYLSAEVRRLEGDSGAAADRLQEILSRNPTLTPLRLQLAKLQIANRQLADAQQNVDKILADAPDDPQALQLRAQLLAMLGKPEEAIAIYKRLDPQQNSDVVFPLASLYMSTGHADEARQMVEALFKKHPTDLRVLQTLLRMSTSKEQAQGYLAMARKAGADKDLLDVLAKGLGGKAEALTGIEDLVSKDPDPYTRALKRYALFRQLGKLDQADQALAEAAKLKPRDPRTVEAVFARDLEKKDWDSAQDQATLAVTLNLDQAQGQTYLGRLALAQGQLDKAVAAFRKVVDLRPVYSTGWRLLGDAQRQSGHPEQAVTSYQKAVNQRPSDVAALRGLAACYDMMHNYPKALESLRAALDFAPGDGMLLNQYLAYDEQHGDPKDALALREKIAQAAPGDTDNLRAVALLQARLGQVDSALKLMNAVVAKEGQTIPNLSVLAAIYSISDQPAKARALLEAHIKALGDKATAADYLLLAKFYLSTNDGNAALEAFHEAIAVEDPKTRPASRELADLLFDRGMFAQCLEYYQRLYELNPKDLRVSQRYVEALLRAGKADLAQTILNKILAQQGTPDATSYVLIGMADRVRGDDAEALKAMKSAVAMAPTRGLFHYQYAEQLVAGNNDSPERIQEALTEINKALELDNNMVPARMLEARIRLQQHDPQEAIRELNTAIKIAPYYLPARQMLAQVYQDTNDLASLSDFLGQCVKLFPKDTSWLRMQARVAQRTGDNQLALSKLTQAVAIEPLPENLYDLAALELHLDQTQNAQALLSKYATVVDKNAVLQGALGQTLATLKQTSAAEAAFNRGLQLAQSLAQATAVNDQMTTALGPARANELLQPLTLGAHGLWSQLCIASNLIQADQCQQALDRLQKLYVLVPDGTPTRLMIDRMVALCYHRTGQKELARQKYLDILKSAPDSVATLNNLAYLLIENFGDVTGAQRYAQQAVSLAPNDPQVLDTQGWIQYKAGLTNSALDTLQRSVRLAPMAPNQYHLAMVLVASGGSHRDAVRYLEAAVKLASQTHDEDTLKRAQAALTNLKN